MRNENYITIQGWMRNVLNLKGNELMVYALIYGFSQDGETEFVGSAGYIAEWIGATKRTVFNTLDALVSKKLLEKTEKYNNGVKTCMYKISPVMKIFHGGDEKFSLGGSEKTSPNNLDNNTISNNTVLRGNKADVYKDIVYDYNMICSRLAKVERLTDSRKKHIKARLGEHSREDLTIAFHKLNESDFACGNNDRGWEADFDWLMKNEENITKVLEGKYDNKISPIEKSFARALNNIRSGVNDNGSYFD